MEIPDHANKLVYGFQGINLVENVRERFGFEPVEFFNIHARQIKIPDLPCIFIENRTS